MRWKIAALGIVFTILSGIIFESEVKAQETVSIDLFYQKLSPYGEWGPHPEFGYIWQPYDVGPEWKPYTDGRWEWSDQGWLWISYEPWGWATYHYGRWVYDDYQGWVWIPGTTWAPAWVSWQESPEYIGWSPLPPDRQFFIEIGFVFNSYNPYYKPYRYKHRHKKHRYYHNYYYNPHHYKPPPRHCVYLPYKKFGHHKHAGIEAVPPEYAITTRNVRNVTNIKYENNKVINYGPDRRRVEKYSKRKLKQRNIIGHHDITTRGNRNVNYVKGKSYNVYKPKIDRVSKDPYTTTRGSKLKSGARKSISQNYNKHNRQNQRLDAKPYDTRTRKPTYNRSTGDYKHRDAKKTHSQRNGYGKYENQNRGQKSYKSEHAIKNKKVQQKANYDRNVRGKTLTTLHQNRGNSKNIGKSEYRKNTNYKGPQYKSKKNSSSKNYSKSRNNSYRSNKRSSQPKSYRSTTRNTPSSQRNRFSSR